MNAHRIINQLVSDELKSVDGIDFHLKRFVKNKIIYKQIRFEAEGKQHAYQESVMALMLEDFSTMFAAADMEVVDTFGNFKLEPFQKDSSDRLIIIAKKK